MKKESRFLKYAIIMSLLAGGLCFGLSASAEDITTGGELSDANYNTNNTLNILNEIELKQGYGLGWLQNDKLPTISDPVNIVVNGNGNKIYGELSSKDHSGFETTGGATLSFNNVNFDSLTYAYSNTTGGIGENISWLMEGAIAHSESSAGNLNFDTIGFTNNNVSLTAERLSADVDMQIQGGLVNNNSTSEIKNSNFSANNVTSTAQSNGFTSIYDHSLNAEILGGAVYNSNQMSISDTIFNQTNATADVQDDANRVTSATATVLGGALYNSGSDLTLSGATKFTNNTATATGHGDASLTLTAQGGALYNSGTATITGITFDGNSAAANATGDELTTVNLTAQGGALYNSGTANISGTTFSNNSVTATGGTAQGGAIYNAANAVINISNSTFTGNTANGSANDIYFAQNSTMNVQQGGDVTINSGLASDDNTAAINIKSGGNLVVADNNSADYTGSVNIEGYGKLTFASQTAPSLENAIIKVTEDYGSVEYKIGSDFTMTENNVTLADGVKNAEIIKSGSNTMTINGDFSDFSGQVSVAEGILKYIADDANDKYYNANSTKVHGGATLIFDIANTTGGGVPAQSLSGLASQPNSSGNGNFIKQGDGTLYMTGDNTEFVGNVTVDAGTLAFDSAQGASSDSFFGSDADITINQRGILYSNIDMAVNGNLKGDGTFKADNINLSVNGDNSGLANFTQTGGETTVASGGSLFKNNNITDGKVIFNANSFLADGSTFKTSNSVVEILNNSDANSIIGAVNNGKNSGLDLILNNSNTTADLNIDGTNIETLTTQGNVTYGGILSGTGGVTNEGTLVLEGDASGFTGTFSQEIADTSTTVAETGKVFGGDKNINAGSLNITAESVNYNKVHLGSDAQLKHTSTGVTGSSTISESVVNFIDGASGATATFNNGDYTLAGAVDNGNANRVVFNNSDVILGDVTNFTGGTTYVLQNSDLDLSADGALKDYSFSNLETDGVVKIDINAEFVDEGSTAAQGYMNTDTLYVGNDGGNTAEFQIGNIFIGGKETGSQRYDTKKDVLDGNAQFDSDTSSGNVQLIGATTSYEYSVGITDDLKSIFLETTGMTDNSTLYDMNKTAGGRFFQFSVGNTGEYHIDKSLSATAEGVFNVTGRNENAADSVLSGEIVASTGGETVDYTNGSFFNIATGVDTELNIKDLTIQNAYKNGSNVSENGSKSANGAVIENNSASAEITVDNVILQTNKADGFGGAIYNNGGTITVTDSIFTNNIATQGGAIYNAAGQLNLANVTLTAGVQTGEGQNDIYNAGNALVQGSNTFGTDITNNGIWEFDTDSSSTVNGNISGSGNITNEGLLALNGNNSAYTGSFTQNGINSVTTVTDKFFGEGSTNTINNGTLNWATEEAWSGNLTVNDGNFNIGQDAQGSTGAINSDITLTSGSIAKDAATGISEGSSLTLDGEDVIVNLNSGATDTSTNDIWNGTVKVTNGTLNIDGFNRNNGTLVAKGGEVTLGSGSLVLNQGSSISEEVTAIVNEGTTTYINGGSLILNDELDEWDGDIIMTDGSLKVDNVTSANNPNGKLQASGGSLEFAGGYLELAEEDSFIAHNVQTNIRDGVTTEVSGGTLQIGNDDIWEDGGTIHLSGGTLDYAVTNPDETGILDADRGNLNLNSGSVLNIQIPSAIEQAVAVDIQSGALVNVNNDAVLNLDSATNDKWNGMIHILDGVLTTDGVTNATGAGGGLQQVSGSSTFDNDSHIYITDADSYIIGGDVAIKNNSSLYLGPDTYEFTVDNLNMENNSALQVMNGVLDEALITNSVINDLNNVTVDLDARHKVGDTFIIDNLKSDSSGILNVADFNFIGGAPVDREIKFQIFDADSIENVDFMATDKAIFTPIGNYKLFSQGSGLYTANLVSYNPQVFRGQAATLAMYNNQLAIDDIILNHVILHSERYLDSDKTANKYASVEPMFAPYQYKKEDGGLWFKSYVNFETLSMSQGLNVGNNAYGAIVGADFPVVDLKDGWKFLPTAFIAYNGSNQNFNHVNMYQNGGQGGFMGTFMKNDFIGSMMAYAGGYNNEMNVAGFNENNGNWFAGTAAKLAYNLHATKHFTIQPTAFISYNIFGKQSWGTDYGVMGMNSGLLNGINVAPGLNLIYARETWSLYGTIQYMFNINEQVGGQAGNVDLPNLNMRHGYLQYGIGATKTWKDRLNSYIQITIRNGGRTGIGFQLGLQYMFDWMNLGKNTKNSNAQKPKTKTILKSMK